MVAVTQFGVYLLKITQNGRQHNEIFLQVVANLSDT